jgi:ribosome biogenesis ATPase
LIFLKRCDGFSGADLSALVIEASMAAFKERLSQAAAATGSGVEVRVGSRHFDAAFNKVKPSVSAHDKKSYETLKRKQQVRAVLKPIFHCYEILVKFNFLLNLDLVT